MPPKKERCIYLKCCYLADALECSGYKLDCVLYQKSNNRECSSFMFDKAVDQLIDRTRAKHNLPPSVNADLTKI